jgi:hypothetical protein
MGDEKKRIQCRILWDKLHEWDRGSGQIVDGRSVAFKLAQISRGSIIDDCKVEARRKVGHACAALVSNIEADLPLVLNTISV